MCYHKRSPEDVLPRIGTHKDCHRIHMGERDVWWVCRHYVCVASVWASMCHLTRCRLSRWINERLMRPNNGYLNSLKPLWRYRRVVGSDKMGCNSCKKKLTTMEVVDVRLLDNLVKTYIFKSLAQTLCIANGNAKQDTKCITITNVTQLHWKYKDRIVHGRICYLCTSYVGSRSRYVSSMCLYWQIDTCSVLSLGERERGW